MNPIVLEFDNELAEHLVADRLYYRSTFWWKADKVVAGLLIVVGICLVFFAGVVWWSVIFFPLAIVEWFNLLSISPLQVRYFFKHNPKFRETYHLTFSDGGIQFKTESMESKLSWSMYKRVLENDTIVLLIYGTRMYAVIPKRAFSDSSQLAEFMELVRRRIPAKDSAGVGRGAVDSEGAGCLS